MVLGLDKGGCAERLIANDSADSGNAEVYFA